MSLSTYRISGITSSSVGSDREIGLVGFELSGLSDSNAIAVCNFEYNYKRGLWQAVSGSFNWS